MSIDISSSSIVYYPPSSYFPNTPKLTPFPLAGISTLRGERESVLSSIEQLQSEKDELEDTLPLLISRLVTLHGGIEESRQEMGVYDGAIGDMCRTYAMILQPGGIDLMTQGGGEREKGRRERGGEGRRNTTLWRRREL